MRIQALEMVVEWNFIGLLKGNIMEFNHQDIGI